MAVSKNLYSLPFKKEDLIRARSDPRVHFAHFKYAIDFVLPIGSQLLAPNAGKVIDIKVDSNKGGADPKYNDIKYLNYMTLQHSNGEYSQFGHLKYQSALVKIGDLIKAGQPVALSGNTGFTTAPHLHFQVFRLNKTKIGWETLNIRFKEKVAVDRKKRPIPRELKMTMKEVERARRQLGK